MNYLKTAAIALAGGAVAVVSMNLPANASPQSDMLTMQAAQTYAMQHGGYLPMVGTAPSYMAPTLGPAGLPQYGYGYNPYYNNNGYYYNNVPQPYVQRQWHRWW